MAVCCYKHPQNTEIKFYCRTMLTTSKDVPFQKVHMKFVMSVKLWIINTTAKLNPGLKTRNKRWWHLRGYRCVTGKSFTTLCKYRSLVWLTGLLILKAWEHMVKNLEIVFRKEAGVIAKNANRTTPILLDGALSNLVYWKMSLPVVGDWN